MSAPAAPVYPVHMATLFDEKFWDERYGGNGAVWSGNPNPQLIAEAADLVTGRALDVGCGEGADALWLAERGWHVVAVDLSSVALQKAARHAAAKAATGPALVGSIEWEHHDLLAWSPPAGSFDLVTAQFMHLPTADREPLFARLAEAVAPGGSLLIVGHSESDILAGARRPHDPELFFTAADVAGSLAVDSLAVNPLDANQWRVEVSEARPRIGTDMNGSQITIHDEVMRAVRLR